MKMFQKLLDLDALLTQGLVISEKPSLLRSVLIFFSHSCDSWFWLLGLAIFWLFARGELRILAAYWIVGMILLAALVLLVKFLIRRERPEGEWGQVYRVTDPHSFPSGHAARAMATAVIASAFAAPWVVLLLVLWALLVGVSRVALKLHYLSDVLVGWAFGALAGGVALAAYPAILALIEKFL